MAPQSVRPPIAFFVQLRSDQSRLAHSQHYDDDHNDAYDRCNHCHQKH